MRPCVLQLSSMLTISTRGLTIRSLSDQCERKRSAMTGHTPSHASHQRAAPFQRSHLLRASRGRHALRAAAVVPTHLGVASSHDDGPANEVFSRALRRLQHLSLKDTPRGCSAGDLDWTSRSPAPLVLSCVSIAQSGIGAPELVAPLATAMNITADDVTILGATFYGCADTALAVHGQRAYIAVRNSLQLPHCP